MGLFGPSKIKITANDFVKNQLDKIFSANFIDAEKKAYESLSKEISILQRANLVTYLKERQNVIYNLFQLAWLRNIPYDIFIEYGSIIVDDQRVKEINSGVYDMCLSKAQEAGMDTFGYISAVFITQIIPQDAHIDEADYSRLYEIYGTDFTGIYISFEALTKQYKFKK
jgi:hypothetical protein